MPQLPPAAAAAFVGCLLVLILATAIVVRVRSRRRGVRLAQMVRTTAPVPRPATSRVAQPPAPAVAVLRGKAYQSAEEFGRFVVFAERPRKEPAPGRPARRLAAQLAYAAAPSAVATPPAVAAPSAAAAPSVVVESAPSPPLAPVVPARPRVVPPSIALAPTSHAGLAEVVLDLDASGGRETRAGPSGSRPRPAAPVPAAPWLLEPLLAREESIAESPWLMEPTAAELVVEEPAAAAAEQWEAEPSAAKAAWDEASAVEPAVIEDPVAEEPLVVVLPEVAEPAAVEPAAEEPVTEPVADERADQSGAEEPPPVEATVEPAVMASAAEAAKESPVAEPGAVDEELKPEFARPPQPPPQPLREPQITVLPPRQAVSALPAMMSREVTLGDAARALRGALPNVLTMTDGRQLRRAVAVGAATSVVAAAFAIRARRR